MKAQWWIRLLSLGIAVSILTLLTSACNNQRTEELNAVVVTYVESPLNMPSIVEKELEAFQRNFEELGISVDYANITSGSEQTQALASGDIQILNAVGVTSVVLAASAGADIKILSGYSRSPQAYMIITLDDSIHSQEDLRGKTIAGPKGTTLNELLAAWLRNADMTVDDIEYMSLSIPDAYAALLSGRIDAALVAGATAWRAVESGALVLTNGEGLIDGMIVTAASAEFCQKYPECVSAFLDAQLQVLTYIQEYPDNTVEMTSKALDITVEDVRKMEQQYTFFAELNEKDLLSIQNTIDFLYENGLIEETLDSRELIWN